MAIIYNKIITLIGVVSFIFGTVFGTTLPVAQNQLKITPSEIIKSEIIYEQIKDNSDNVASGQYSALYKYAGQEIPLSVDEIKRTNNTRIFKTGNKYTVQVYAGDVFYNKAGKWYAINSATTTIRNFNAQINPQPPLLARLFKNGLLGNIFAVSTSTYGGKGDGWCETNTNTSWANVHATTTCNGAGSTDVINEFYSLSNVTTYKIARSAIPFPTGVSSIDGIPANATITSSTLYLYINAKTNGDNDGDDFTVVIASTTQASTTVFVAEDYDQIGSELSPVEGSQRIDITNATTSFYSQYILNTSGLSAIKKIGEASTCGTQTGWTCLGLREGHDVINSAIVTGGGFVINRLKYNSANNTIATSTPYLSITYTVPATGTVSCSVDNSSTAFGTLTTGAITASSLDVTASSSCTYSAGCTLTVMDAGSGSNPGLWNSTSSAIIGSSNASYAASSTLVAGTVGYGVRATTTTAGSGGTLGIAARYNTGLANGLLGSAQDVGGLSITAITLASSTATYDGREIIVTHKAAIASDTPGGNYNDTITYGCTGN